MDESTGTPASSDRHSEPPRSGGTRPRFVAGYGLVLVMLAATYFVLAGAGDGRAGRALTGEAFFSQQTAAATSSLDHICFSFVTMTTTGFGDLSAAGDLGRMLAVTEAVVGQLYLIVVVSLVVQALAESRRRSSKIPQEAVSPPACRPPPAPASTPASCATPARPARRQERPRRPPPEP